jgi:hypothetical protein
VAGAALEAKHVENFTGSSMAVSARRYGRGLHRSVAGRVTFPGPLLRYGTSTADPPVPN